MLTFDVTYRISGQTESDARILAAKVAREQTIECIDEGVPHPFIFEEVLAHVVSFTPVSNTVFDAVIAFNADVSGYELTQLINMLYGNCSMLRGVQLTHIEIPTSLAAWLKGPRFGIEGIRKLTGNARGAMICAAIKPIGLSATEMAAIAYRCALGGVDMIKDDHGLANQRWAPFEARVAAVAQAVARANRETGGNTLYAPSLNTPIDAFEKRAQFAADAGAGAYLVMPTLTSVDSIRFLAQHETLSRPIVLHPSFMGAFMMSEDTGISHHVLYGQVARLAGADVSIFPSTGGRYGYDKEHCISIAEACRDPNSIFKPILPGPGGGMTLATAALSRAIYGNDTMYVFGGAAMQYGDRIADGIRELRAALSAG